MKNPIRDILLGEDVSVSDNEFIINNQDIRKPVGICGNELYGCIWYYKFGAIIYPNPGIEEINQQIADFLIKFKEFCDNANKYRSSWREVNIDSKSFIIFNKIGWIPTSNCAIDWKSLNDFGSGNAFDISNFDLLISKICKFIDTLDE